MFYVTDIATGTVYTVHRFKSAAMDSALTLNRKWNKGFRVLVLDGGWKKGDNPSAYNVKEEMYRADYSY